MGTPYKRVVVKISGNVLFNFDHGTATEIDPDDALTNLLTQLITCQKQGVELLVIFGGGNICRGREMEKTGVSRITADNIGMLSTLINSLVVREKLSKMGAKCVLTSAFAVTHMCKQFEPFSAMHFLADGYLVICAGGTGNPFVTTDTAASLRGIQTNCDALIKLTDVQGLYDKDPGAFADAKMLKSVDYDYCLNNQSNIFDLGAFSQCKSRNLPVHIASYSEPEVLMRIVNGGNVGTKISKDGTNT